MSDFESNNAYSRAWERKAVELLRDHSLDPYDRPSEGAHGVGDVAVWIDGKLRELEVCTSPDYDNAPVSARKHARLEAARASGRSMVIVTNGTLDFSGEPLFRSWPDVEKYAPTMPRRGVAGKGSFYTFNNCIFLSWDEFYRELTSS